MASPYEAIAYPSQIDSFVELADGRNPENLIRAAHLNKVGFALQAVEAHVWYTPTCASAAGTGHLIYTAATSFVCRRPVFPAPNLRLQVPLAIDPTAAQLYFGGSPFSRAYGITVSALAWRWSGVGQKSYAPVRAAVNVGQELGNLSCTVVVCKVGPVALLGGDQWLRGDHCDVVLHVIRP